MKFGFIAKHRGIWPAEWLCEALGVSRGGFYAWLTRPRSQRSRSDEALGAKVRASFLASDRTYGARRIWHDMLAEGISCGLHRIERLMRLQALKARPRRRRLPPDLGERQVAAVAANVLDRSFEAPAPNRKWIADFTYVWTAEGWLYVAAVVDLFSRRVVGWSMSASMTAQFVTDALVMAIWRRGKPDALLHHSDRGSQYTSEQFQRLMVSLGVEFSLIVGAENSLAGAWPGGLGRAPDLRAVRPSPIIPSDMIRIGGGGGPARRTDDDLGPSPPGIVRDRDCAAHGPRPEDGSQIH